MRRLGLSVLLLAFLISPTRLVAEPPQFESPHIHPIDIVGNKVLVVNTPDARLSVFNWSQAQDELFLVNEIRVGTDPITVRAKDADEAWVVNHLSDDVSIVDLNSGTVVHTLHVGDEPTDLVFIDDPIEDDGSKWAVLSVSQEDRVLVCDAESPYTLFGAIDIPGADPRGLTVDANGTGVWVAVFESGNMSTLIPRTAVADSTNNPWGGGLPPFDPPLNPALPDSMMPTNGVMVRWDGFGWKDELGGDWSYALDYGLYNNDLVHIDCSSGTPVLGQTVGDVGTNIYDVARNPETGDIWAVTIEAFNQVLYEPKLKGEGVRNRVARLTNGSSTADIFELNNHVTFGPLGQPAPRSPQNLVDDSVAIPTEILFAKRNGTMEGYVTGIGGKRIAVLNPNNGNVKRRLAVPEGGTGLVKIPGDTGVVLPLSQPVQQELYRAAIKTGDLLMVNRHLNTVHVIDPVSGDTGESVPIGMSAWDPTPTDVKRGRAFLYTAANSAHGTFACASCHPDGNMDAIVWDLGDPSGDMDNVNGFDFHPLKGPMITQSLRGLKDHNPLHWRGDKEDFLAFNGAFESLLGGDQLAPSDMQLFETFMLSVQYPPNPYYDLNDEVGVFPSGGDPNSGRAIFDTTNCENCHTFPTGTGNQTFFLGDPLGNQNFLVAQNRNGYEKAGFVELGPNNKRAFGFLHDGFMRSSLEFLLVLTGFNVQQVLDVDAFLQAFPTGNDGALAQEATINPFNLANDPSALQRASDLQNAADEGRVDLIAHGVVNGLNRGFVWVSDAAGGLYQSDRTDRVYTFDELVAEAQNNGSAITFMAAPLGEGVRMGVDRDKDGFLDGDEEDAGSDPADPNSTPGSLGVGDDYQLNPQLTRVSSIFPQPFTSDARIELYVAQAGKAKVEVFDVNGRRVRSLVDGPLSTGSQTIHWNGLDDSGRAVASGTYFLRLSTRDVQDTRKVVRIR